MLDSIFDQLTRSARSAGTHKERRVDLSPNEAKALLDELARRERVYADAATLVKARHIPATAEVRLQGRPEAPGGRGGPEVA